MVKACWGGLAAFLVVKVSDIDLTCTCKDLTCTCRVLTWN